MVHSTAICEAKSIGFNTKIWAYSHLCKGCTIGNNCMIGERVYIGPNVRIGNNVKIQNHSLIYEGVEIEDGAFVGPGVITTNDLMPRSTGDWADRFQKTLIKKGASIGAGSVIICGIVLGEKSMVGAGSVVTTNVEPNWLVIGNPAKHVRFLDD